MQPSSTKNLSSLWCLLHSAGDDGGAKSVAGLFSHISRISNSQRRPQPQQQQQWLHIHPLMQQSTMPQPSVTALHPAAEHASSAAAAAAPAGFLRGLLSWFPVHPTSLNNTNTLLSGDNKGAAEQFVEKRWAPQQQGLEPGFLAAFVQSNGADTSPNILGTFCLDTGEDGLQDGQECLQGSTAQ
jgi:hypothetical protein